MRDDYFFLNNNSEFKSRLFIYDISIQTRLLFITFSESTYLVDFFVIDERALC